MADNKTLANAKAAKNNEFYTQLGEIANELRHYKEHFKGKVVFCNCDDPFESNFFKYFAMSFNHLGLKKLICTCYRQSPVAWTQLSLFENENVVVKTEGGKDPYKIEITEVEDYNGDGAVDLTDVEYLLKNKKNSLSVLHGDGDFRSAECVELLKEADIVVTNPPFSLFKEYVTQLIEYDKKFLIIGNVNAITYKEIFPLIINNKIWSGMIFNKTMEFIMADDYELKGKAFVDKNGKKHGFVPGVCWFTNLDIKKRHTDLALYKQYVSTEYPRYETFDAIDVANVTDIPYDYYGIMGVPKTFLDKYNPNQFEILGYEREDENISIGIQNMPADFLKKYREQGGKGHYTTGMKMLCFYDNNGKAKIPFSRILIRRKNNEN